jgi:probable rRNA maturation factor
MALLKKMVRKTVELCMLSLAEHELNIMFVGDKKMAEINSTYLGHTGTTDVISFCYLEATEPLLPDETAVELIVGVDVAMREGTERDDSSYAAELTLYIVHGLLHAAGEDDLEPKAAQRMRREEKRVMTALAQEFVFDDIFQAKRII